ncbi:beta-1,4-endoglucanase [Acephala macrosclerotiorum]|nr:beta-1,4-endoglucanase [Acephala macrosclerotiorum]
MPAMISRVLVLLCGLSTVLGQVQYMGMNIAGFDFGCATNGSCDFSTMLPPLTKLGGSDGAAQMQHFLGDDQMNTFRLPVPWQYLTNNVMGGDLDPTNFGKYDQLMQTCLNTTAYCIIDLHNYARWNDLVIGQSDGAPTNEQFADLWAALATKYKNEPKVIFGIMNEPHDLDIVKWADTVQAAVTAIRKAGATTQMILLPGTNFSCAVTFTSTGSASALMSVVNLDNSTTNLVYDVHQYLDFDNSGTHSTCSVNTTAGFAELASWLRSNGRQAVVGETGAGSDSSCLEYFCAQNTVIQENADVFIGFFGWAAGSFATDYVLSMTPSQATNGKWTDNTLVSECVIAPWLVNNTAVAAKYSSALTAIPTATSSSASSTSTKKGDAASIKVARRGIEVIVGITVIFNVII